LGNPGDRATANYRIHQTAMITTPFLARITLYPIKALDGVDVAQATVSSGGALCHDREWALFDAQGRFVNGKHNAQVHRLRCQFSADLHRATLWADGTTERQHFCLDQDALGQGSRLSNWLSEFFESPIELRQDAQIGFPDDTVAYGPTVLSTDTIKAVSAWFPGLSIESMRLRLRANLELAGVAPFWEDQLFAAVPEQTIAFQIGDVRFEGVNPCQRCIVPTRDPLTGESYPHFQKTFVAQRQVHLPNWTASNRFNHYYRLSVNTRIPGSEAGKSLHIGDPVQLSPR
jgi:hypothetical protein